MHPYLKIYTIAVILGSYLGLVFTFIKAYFNNMQILVKINTVGEATIELTILVSSVFLLIKWVKETWSPSRKVK